MRKLALVHLILCPPLLFLCPAAMAGEGRPQEPVREVVAVDFWWMEKLGQLRNVSVGADEVTAEALGAHGYARVRVSRQAYDDPEARTAGYKKAMKQLIDVMEENRDFPALVEDYRKRLEKMTGLDLGSAAAWDAWFVENRDYLVWSPQEERFVLDLEAKKAGVPASEYRRSRPEPKER